MIAPVYDEQWPDDVKALYEHDMQEMWDPNRMRHIWNLYHRELERYYEKVAQFAEGPLRIMDVGCAQGTLALTLAEKGHQVVALDLRQQFLDYAKSRYESGDISFVCANALELELDEKFDVVFANQIVEHLVYPVEFFAGLSKRLRPGGLLVATTPNQTYRMCSQPTFTSLGDPSQYEDRQFTSDGDGHFFAYTPDELQACMQAAGLESVNVEGYCSPWISGHMKVRYLHGVLPYGLLKTLDDRAIRGGFRNCFQLMGTGYRKGGDA